MPESPRSQFRLPHWGWFVLVTFALVIAETGLSIWMPYYREQQVIQMIVVCGGRVETETGSPEWLQQLVGEARDKGFKVFKRVFLVDLDSTAITDASLAKLTRLKNLRILYLRATGVTDAGITHLKGLTTLGGLHLRGTAVTDKGIKELQKALPDCEIAH